MTASEVFVLFMMFVIGAGCGYFIGVAREKKKARKGVLV